MDSTNSPAGWRDLIGEGRLGLLALVCLGAWLGAADALVTATIMPSVGAELSGYVFFGWATSGYFLGSIVAAASAGRLSEGIGLKGAIAGAGLVYAAGCLISALSPSMAVFLGGRLLQGIGAGWIGGFSFVAISHAYSGRHLPRVFAATAAMWGIATLLGPLIGGAFASAGVWRASFWFFGVQALAFSAAALVLAPPGRPVIGAKVPWIQLGLLTLGVGALALANLGDARLAVTLTAAGLALLVLLVRYDASARNRLLPRSAGRLSTAPGAGYAAIFALTAASMGLAVYGPAILQALRGHSPLMAGYVIGVEAIAWTICAWLTAGAGPAREGALIRIGSLCMVAGIAVLAFSLADGPLIFVILGAALLGSAFGLSWSFFSRRILAGVQPDEAAVGASALSAVRETGAAAGAAVSAVAANLSGFAAGPSQAATDAAAFWIFAAAAPLAVAGAWAAFRAAR